jgi:hypothetical protein
VTDDPLAVWRRLLAEAPDADGGRVAVLATSSSPPAMSLLTTSSIVLDGDRVTVAVQAGSTAAQRDADGFTLLAEDGGGGQRLEVVAVSRRRADHLVLLEGTIHRGVAMAEAPWRLDLRFRPEAGDAAPLLRFWEQLRRWLRGGAAGPPPAAEA